MALSWVCSSNFPLSRVSAYRLIFRHRPHHRASPKDESYCFPGEGKEAFSALTQWRACHLCSRNEQGCCCSKKHYFHCSIYIRRTGTSLCKLPILQQQNYLRGNRMLLQKPRLHLTAWEPSCRQTADFRFMTFQSRSIEYYGSISQLPHFLELPLGTLIVLSAFAVISREPVMSNAEAKTPI